MEKRYVMALDAGTTSNRAIIFDENSQIMGVSQKEFTQYFPQPGWVEHDANEILKTMMDVMQAVLEQTGLTAAEISAKRRWFGINGRDARSITRLCGSLGRRRKFAKN